ncbi:glutamine amidotransferase-related protein [Candidatus Carsonella ruddii]|uniref:glutamine amidotransferase-related protein n=1 Tax=Carsonella ruddii TaxID=114186 RepID=UPI003D5587B7
MILFLDNYDSFSYNIIRKIYCKNIKINFKNFNIKNINFKLIYEKILLFGPGPNNVVNSNLNTLILDKFLNKKKIIGVCLGHQVIDCYFGYYIYKLNIFFHGQFKNILFYNKKYKIFIFKKLISYNSLSCLGIKLQNFSKFNFELFIVYNFFLKLKTFQFHPESILSSKNNFI